MRRHRYDGAPFSQAVLTGVWELGLQALVALLRVCADHAGEERSEAGGAGAAEAGSCLEDPDEEVFGIATLCPQALHLLHHLLCCWLANHCLFRADLDHNPGCADR